MSAPETKPEEQTAESEEPGERAERIARLVLAVVAGLALWGLLAAFPYLAYVVVGVLSTLGWQAVRARLSRGHDAPATPEMKAPTPDVGEALRHLVGDDNGVLLTRLRDDLKLPDTKVVKQLLDEAGVTWKAVRTSHGNGPGVHKNDIPSVVSSPVGDAHGNGCCCRSSDNTNTDNGQPGNGQEGIRVERTDGGFIVYDLSGTDRHGSARN